MPDEEMPDIEFEDDGPVDLTPLLLRQFAWDSTPCDEVNELLAALGLPPSAPGEDGEDGDHITSHYRMSMVLPLENLLRGLSSVVGTVLATSMTEHRGITGQLDMKLFAGQTAEIALSASRSIIAHLVENRVLMYGPAVVDQGAIVILEGDGTDE